MKIAKSDDDFDFNILRKNKVLIVLDAACEAVDALAATALETLEGPRRSVSRCSANR